MKRQILLSLLFMLVLAISASASFTISENSKTLNFDGLEDINFTVSINNTNTTANITMTTSIGDFAANGYTIPSSNITVTGITNPIVNGTSQVATINVNLIGTDTSSGIYDAMINFTDGTTVSSYNLTLDVDRDMLVFDDIDYDINVSSSSNLTGKGNITPNSIIKVNEGNLFKIGGNVSSLFSSNPGTEIKDVKVVLEIENMDNGSNLTQIDTLGNISYGDDEEFNFSFNVPENVLTNGTLLESNISVSGNDTYNNVHYAEIKFYVMPIISNTNTSNNNSTNTTNTTTTSTNMLDFVDVEWDIVFPRSEEDDEDDDGDIYEGYSITIGEGSTLTISGDVVNLFNESQETEIMDIDVFLDIDDADLGDDYEEDVGLGDLEYGEDDSFEFVVEIPYGEYSDNEIVKAYLTAEGRDNKNNIYKASLTFDLKMDKESEEVTIMSAYFSEDIVRCDDSTTLFVELRNTGRKDLEVDKRNWVLLNFFSTDLDFIESIREIELDEDDEEQYSLDIDTSNLPVGSYTIEVEAYTDEGDDLRDYFEVSFRKDQCIVTTTKAPVTTTIAPTYTTIPSYMYNQGNQDVTNNAVSTEKTEKTSAFDMSEESYVVLLIILFVVLLVVGGVMVAYFMKN